MQLYHSFPATDYSWTAASIKSLRQLRRPKQGALNQIVFARIELARLVVFTTIELGAHIAAAAAKTAAAIVQLPLRPLFGGVTSRVAIVDAGAHLARALKLAPALLCAPLLGLARPEWSLDVFQRLSLVKEPHGRFAAAIMAAWKSRYRNHVLVCAALTIAAIAIGRRYFSAPIDRGWGRLSLWGSVAGITSLAVGLYGAYRCRKGSQGPSTLVIQHPHLTVGRNPIADMRLLTDGKSVLVAGGKCHLYSLEIWNANGAKTTLSKPVNVFTVLNNGTILTALGKTLSHWDANGDYNNGKEVDGDNISCLEELPDKSIAVGHANGIVEIFSEQSDVVTFSNLKQQISVIKRLSNEMTVAATVSLTEKSHIAVWHKRSLNKRFTVDHAVWCLDTSPNEKLLAVSSNCAVKIFGLGGNLATTLGSEEGENTVNAIKWLSDGRIVVGKDNGELHIWTELDGSYQPTALQGHKSAIYQIKEMDGPRILTTCRTGTVRSWPLNLAEGNR